VYTGTGMDSVWGEKECLQKFGGKHLGHWFHSQWRARVSAVMELSVHTRLTMSIISEVLFDT
jgi:hypothetical protein